LIADGWAAGVLFTGALSLDATSVAVELFTVALLLEEDYDGGGFCPVGGYRGLYTGLP